MRKPLWAAFSLFAGLIACGNLFPLDSLAQNYPAKPIRILVGFSPGGAADVTARLVGQKLSEELGQPVIIENRTGASGTIANARVATSPPDGYTLLTLSSSAAILPALRAHLPYDLERDLAPVSLVVTGSFVLVVHPSMPVRNVQDLVALARLQPGKLNYGSPSVGSANHLAGELFTLMAKLDIKHVPYKGGAENVTATVAGQIEMTFASVTASASLIGAGKLRPLGLTGAKRALLLPKVPTISESGLPGYDLTSWYAVLGPAGMPKDIIARLNTVIVKAANAGELKDAFIKQGLEPQSHTPEQFGTFIRTEVAKNAKLIKAAGIKPD